MAPRRPSMAPTRPRKDATGKQAWEAPTGPPKGPLLLLLTLFLSASVLQGFQQWPGEHAVQYRGQNLPRRSATLALPKSRGRRWFAVGVFDTGRGGRGHGGDFFSATWRPPGSATHLSHPLTVKKLVIERCCAFFADSWHL
eukprot:4824340-Pyramimonas_sp.AAC.3